MHDRPSLRFFNYIMFGTVGCFVAFSAHVEPEFLSLLVAYNYMKSLFI